MLRDTDAAWLKSLQKTGIHFGLTRMQRILHAVDDPQRKYESILVAGTNGKGSTAAMLASILESDGRRTGLFTSPAISDDYESWTFGGTPIDESLLAETIDDLQKATRTTGVMPTYFEALTAIAFIAFAKAHADIAVIEVGMGGSDDATNVVRPVAAVITPIGMDHMEYLGNTLRLIARKKAGIIHRGAIVLTSNDDPVILDVIRKRAAKFGNEVHIVDSEHDTPLEGDFQRRNAALAVATARALGIDEPTIERGVKNTKWRGRLEHVRVRGKDIWIDGAHNAHAARAIAPFIESLRRPRLLVFGIMSDKQVGDVEAVLYPLFDRIITTEPFPPRSAKASDLARNPNAVAVPNPDDAFERALASAEPVIFITGSLYLAGAAIAFFDKIRK